MPDTSPDDPTPDHPTDDYPTDDLTPDRPSLDPAAVRVPGWRVEVFPDSPSTNAYVASRARAGEPAGLVVAAEHQTAGRGRLDRTWFTPARAALTVSALVVPRGVPLPRWPWLPLLTGLAVVDAVATTGVQAVLKWPNDVLVDEAKLAGILVEVVETPSGRVAVVGVGLNVSSTRTELPVVTATSLTLAGAVAPDRTALLSGVLTRLSHWYDVWRSGDLEGLRVAYTQACSTVGRRVRVELPGGAPLEGQALGVDPEGRLLVDDGLTVHVLGAGDVVHVRAWEAEAPE